VQCYYHQSAAAVGICRNCGRGLCPECAVDLVDGLACRDRCEAKVRSGIALVDTANRQRKTAGTSLFLVITGLVIIGLGGLLWRDGARGPGGLFVLLGGAFIAYGTVLERIRRLGRDRQPEESSA
jgi:hypothetical protein